MSMIRMDGKYHNNESWSRENIEDLIKRYDIGGLITFSGNVYGTYNNIKHYQNLLKKMIDDSVSSAKENIWLMILAYQLLGFLLIPIIT